MSRITRGINKVSMAVINISGKLIFYILVIALLVTGAKRGYEFGHSIFFSPGMEAEPGKKTEITLTGDESVTEVGRLLENSGLIRDDLAFTIQAYCYAYDVKAGTFGLNTSMSSKAIIMELNEERDE